MREIKFRAWDKKLKSMFYVQSLDFEEKIYFGKSADGEKFAYALSFNSSILMQYIDFDDNNDKNIYEGDILQINYCGNKRIFIADMFNLRRQLDDFGGIPEILGNIYENPELINERD